MAANRHRLGAVTISSSAIHHLKQVSGYLCITVFFEKIFILILFLSVATDNLYQKS